MIRKLHIENYALIDRLDIEFHSGFSVITGETGAGKSIILGAIGLLLGQRAISSDNRNGEKTVVEAVFDINRYDIQQFFDDNDLDYDEECVIRREISAAGKSRAFVNDTPVLLSVLKDLGDILIDIHSQHQNLLLNQEHFKLDILDTIARDKELLEQYHTSFIAHQNAEKALAQALENTNKNKEEEEYIRFQAEQLIEAKLRDGEQEALEQEAEILSHSEEIKESLFSALRYLSSDSDDDTLENIRQSVRVLEEISDMFPVSEELAQRLDSCYIELKDIADELESQSENVEFNPKRLEQVNDRLNTIYSLQQKHHLNTVGELLELQAKLEQKLNVIDNSEEIILELQKASASAKMAMDEKASVLTQERIKAGTEVERQITERLVSLGMPNVRFKVNIEQKQQPDSTGYDSVEFMFSANKNVPLQNMADVASGGEIARVMLSLKAMIASAVQLPTIIFDEIDTGVSGRMAEKMALIMKEMGNGGRQVISITHLPQIAAVGRHHYRVFKEDSQDRTLTHITELSEEQRIEELAKMLSGEVMSEAALANAKELLGIKK